MKRLIKRWLGIERLEYHVYTRRFDVGDQVRYGEYVGVISGFVGNDHPFKYVVTYQDAQASIHHEAELTKQDDEQ